MEYHSGKQTNDFEYTVRKPKSQANPVRKKCIKCINEIHYKYINNFSFLLFYIFYNLKI